TVRAVNGGVPGRRAVAGHVRPSGGTCALAALDNDYTIDSLIAPHSGRAFTSTQLGNSTPVSIELKNLGTIPPGTSFVLSYRVNGGTVVNESSNATVPPNGAYAYTFATPVDFSTPGTYNLQVWVTYPGDPQAGNDTLSAVVRQLRNDPVTLSPAFTEGFESAAPGTYPAPAR